MTKNDAAQTPLLMLNLPKFDNNIDRLYQRIKNLNCNLRPHLKTAKSVALLNRMKASPYSGITVSTLHEAEYFFANGVTDILYAVTIAPNKFERALKLIKQNQEHGLIDLSNAYPLSYFPVGTKMIILPNHACMTAAAYDKYHAIDDSGNMEYVSRINGW